MSMSSLVLPVLLVLFCGSSRAYYDQQVQRLQGSDDGPDDALSYLLPSLTQKYRPPHGNWDASPESRFIVLTEGDMDQEQHRVKRNNGPSLSIVNSLDVLRQRLQLEIARRRMRQFEDQINTNREILNTIGKREVSQSEQQAATTSVMTSPERGHANSVGNSRSHDSQVWSALSRGERKQL